MLLLGILGLGWAVAGILPTGLPAWPAGSAAILALSLSRRPGRAALRGLGSFFAFVAALLTALKIAALYGLLSLLG